MNDHTQTKDLITSAKHVVDYFDGNMIERLFFALGAAEAFWIGTAVKKLRDSIAKAEQEVQP